MSIGIWSQTAADKIDKTNYYFVTTSSIISSRDDITNIVRLFGIKHCFFNISEVILHNTANYSLFR